jgi:hypothetical protein
MLPKCRAASQRVERIFPNRTMHQALWRMLLMGLLCDAAELAGGNDNWYGSWMQLLARDLPQNGGSG